MDHNNNNNNNSNYNNNNNFISQADEKHQERLTIKSKLFVVR